MQLVRAPRGVKKFHSPLGERLGFKRTLRRTGIYRLVCSYHEGMDVTIGVRC